MYCSKCGQQISDGVYYCEHCGEPVNKPYTQQPFHSRENTNRTYQQVPPQFNQYTPEAYEYMIMTKIDEVRTFGIIAIIAGLFIPILGILLGCIGISKLNDIPLSNQYRLESELKKKKAKNLCIAGIVIPIVLWILAVIFIILFLNIVGYGILSAL